LKHESGLIREDEDGHAKVSGKEADGRLLVSVFVETGDRKC
jgi:hypothetical protein